MDGCRENICNVLLCYPVLSMHLHIYLSLVFKGTLAFNNFLVSFSIFDKLQTGQVTHVWSVHTHFTYTTSKTVAVRVYILSLENVQHFTEQRGRLGATS